MRPGNAEEDALSDYATFNPTQTGATALVSLRHKKPILTRTMCDAGQPDGAGQQGYYAGQPQQGYPTGLPQQGYNPAQPVTIGTAMIYSVHTFKSSTTEGFLIIFAAVCTQKSFIFKLRILLFLYSPCL